MPVTAAVGDVYQVKMIGQLEGQVTNNVFYFTSGAGDTDIETHLILVLIACFVDHIIPVLTNKFKLQEVKWQRVTPTLGVQYSTAVTTGGTGGGGGDNLPSFVSVVSSLKTALGGRRHRGRFYLPGIPEGPTDGSLIDTGSAFWTAYLAFLACLATNFIVGDPPAANSWQQVILSRAIGGNHFPVTNTGAYTAVTNYEPHAQLGTTRSRKIGHGS